MGQYCSCLPPASASSTWEHLGGRQGQREWRGGKQGGGREEVVAVAGDTVQQHGEIIAATLCSSTRDGRFFSFPPLDITQPSLAWPRRVSAQKNIEVKNCT